ncbi:hypothetical protein ALC56_03514, partial [Trachymyrmex septentrionalis]
QGRTFSETKSLHDAAPWSLILIHVRSLSSKLTKYCTFLQYAMCVKIFTIQDTPLFVYLCMLEVRFFHPMLNSCNKTHLT